MAGYTIEALHEYAGMADACKAQGKTMRFSEVTCCGDTDTDYVGVAEVVQKDSATCA